jgi:hypothetical protein
LNVDHRRRPTKGHERDKKTARQPSDRSHTGVALRTISLASLFASSGSATK